jgi:uncharacterized protein YjbI with pentapeptide repeats
MKDDLARKNLDDVNLAGADLSHADLSNASLRRSRLKGANLQHATLAGADLHGAQLDHADLTDADLRDADLTGATLRGVDLDRAAMTDGLLLAGAKGVDGEVERSDREQPADLHLPQTVEEMMALNREIAETAHTVFGATATTGQRSGVSADADRRAAIEHIEALKVRRNLLEERLLSIIAEGITPTPGPTIVEGDEA